MIVVPKPNPLNINRLGHHHHHHAGFPHPAPSVQHAQSTPAASSAAMHPRRVHKPTDLSLARTPPASPPRSPLNRHKHQYSNSKGSFTFGFPSPTFPSHPSAGSYVTTATSRHRHTNSGYAAVPARPIPPSMFFMNGGFMTTAPSAGAGPELEMALDLSDMSPLSSPSPSPCPSPTRAPRLPSPPHAPLSHFSFSSTTSTPIPMRSMHTRAPSAPILSYSPTASSFERDRYANSTFQNSPPPASLPKPKFLSGDADVFN